MPKDRWAGDKRKAATRRTLSQRDELASGPDSALPEFDAGKRRTAVQSFSVSKHPVAVERELEFEPINKLYQMAFYAAMFDPVLPIVTAVLRDSNIKQYHVKTDTGTVDIQREMKGEKEKVTISLSPEVYMHLAACHGYNAMRKLPEGFATQWEEIKAKYPSGRSVER